jgi:uncharacterized protein YdeI (YjbR/CyaY-like superfamily)
MVNQKLASGVVHTMPTDLRNALNAAPKALKAWEDITPLARNEWICLVVTAKQVETRSRRIRRTVDQLKAGKRRPCCWAGCIHR